MLSFLSYLERRMDMSPSRIREHQPKELGPVDRVIAWISPGWALRRARARLTLTIRRARDHEDALNDALNRAVERLWSAQSTFATIRARSEAHVNSCEFSFPESC